MEPLHGVDDLAGAIRGVWASPGRRLGILVDHLIEARRSSVLSRRHWLCQVPGTENRGPPVHRYLAGSQALSAGFEDVAAGAAR